LPLAARADAEAMMHSIMIAPAAADDCYSIPASTRTANSKAARGTQRIAAVANNAFRFYWIMSTASDITHPSNFGSGVYA
jgi:hypothetical protein